MGPPLDSEIWELLVETERVTDHLLAPNKAPFSGLVSLYRRMAMERGISLEGEERIDLRGPAAEAISDAIADLAAQADEVAAFREDEMAGGLLAWDAVADWIKAAAQADGPPGGYLQVPYAGDVKIEWATGRLPVPYPVPPIEVSERHPAHGVTRPSLAYALPGDGAVRRIYVSPGGRLDRLKHLSDKLSGDFNWQPAQATIFVLTGIPPAYSRASAVVQHYAGRDRHTARIILDVHPSTPPPEVMALYRDARREFMTPFGGPKRRRPMAEKSLALAAFAREDARGTWEERMQRWNAARPKWAYTDARNFHRDVTRITRWLQEAL